MGCPITVPSELEALKDAVTCSRNELCEGVVSESGVYGSILGCRR